MVLEFQRAFIMRNVIIVGGGIAALSAARALEESIRSRSRVQLTLISDRAYFTFKPFLPLLVTGEMHPASVQRPLRELLDPMTRLKICEVTHVDIENRIVSTPEGALAFDYLLMATGTIPSPEISTFNGATAFHNGSDAVRLRETLAAGLQDQRWIVIGGGPAAVTTAAVLRRSERGPQITVVEKGPALLSDFDPKLQEGALRWLEKQGVEVLLRAEVTHSQNRLHIGHQMLPGDKWIWAGGVTPGLPTVHPALPMDDQGYIRVRKSMQVEGYRNVYAAGDITSSSEIKNALRASHQGERAGRNIIADLSGRSRRIADDDPVDQYVSLSRSDCMAIVKGRYIDGRAAALLYRMVYSSLFPDLGARVRALIGW